MKQSTFLLDLSSGILSSLLSAWLEMGDLGRLDSALCCVSFRSKFLATLNSRGFVAVGNSEKVTDDQQLLWLFSRRVQLKALSIRDPDLNFCAQDCAVFGRLENLEIFYRNRLRVLIDGCASNLKALKVSGCESIFQDAFHTIFKCAQLRTLHIDGMNKYMDRKKPTSRPNYISSVENTKLLYLKTFVCDWWEMPLRNVHELLDRAPALQHIQLKGIACNDSVIEKIVRYYPDLKSIQLIRCCLLSSEGINQLSALNHLECLDVNGSAGVCNDAVMNIITANPALRTVNLRHGRELTSLCVMKIAATCPNLTALDIAYCPFMKDDALLLIANKCPLLQDIQLCECEFITDTGMLRLANMCTKLTRVNIKSCSKVTKLTCDAFEFMGVKPYKRKLI